MLSGAGENAIEAVSLAKSFRRWPSRRAVHALSGVTLRIPRGSAFGLIGPNGAGKTTFIKILLGIVRATGGSARVMGLAPEDPRSRAKVGYLPERLHLPKAWRPLELLGSVARMRGHTPKRGELEGLLERVGLTEAASRPLGGFSKGMKQRLGIASALVGAPELLVLDEPTDGIDPLGRAQMRSLLQRELERGATVLLNSHLLSETERVCDRIGVLVDGRLVREGPLSTLLSAPDRWRARFEGGAEAAIAAAGFTRSNADGPWQLDHVDAARLNAALDRARAGGAVLLELKQHAEDLESLLQRAVGGEP